MRAKNFTLYLALFLALAMACNDDGTTTDVLYLSQGNINFTVSGKHSGYDFKLEDAYSLYANYSDSRQILNQDGSRYVIIRRYSEDFQNYIGLQLKFDPAGKYTEDSLINGVFFNFNLLVDDHTYIHLEDLPVIIGCYNLPCPELTLYHKFSDLSFDPGSGTIKGKFGYLVNDYVDLSGSFEAQVFEIVK